MYGNHGKPLRLLEAYIAWREQQLEERGLTLQEADARADFTSFLFGPIRQAMLWGYDSVAPQWRRYVRVESAPDFDAMRFRGLNRLRGMAHVGEHAEFPGMRRTERAPVTVIVDTYGGVYEVTRQLIRADNTRELLNRIPADMGQEAGRYVNEAVVALIVSNPTMDDGVAFFHSSRGNKGTAALSEDALADAISAMEDQLDEDGGRIRVQPSLLVVKSARMQLIANRILNSQLTGTSTTVAMAAGAGSNVFDKGVANPLAGILPSDGVVRDPNFPDSNDWYLQADPNQVPAWIAAFLDGNETPFIGIKNPEVRNLAGAGDDPYDYDIDKIGYKMRLDFGLAPADPKGAYWSQVA